MNAKKEQLKKPLALGSWISSGLPLIAELAVQYPFHWLLLDFEHGHASDACLPEMLRAIGRVSTAIIVRVPYLDPAAIARALDWGADGIMLPRVRSASEAKDCVAAMRYAPFGSRGYSSSVRAYDFGKTPPADTHEVAPILFVQIEDVEGVRECEAIAAVEGVDVLFVGPADLKIDLAGQQTPAKLTFDKAISHVSRTAATYGKGAGILLRDHQQTKAMQAIGFNCIAVDSDIAILRKGYERIMKLMS